MAIPDIVVNIAADTDSLASGLTAAQATLSNFTSKAVSTFQAVSEASTNAADKMAIVTTPLKEALASGVFGEMGQQAAEGMNNLTAAVGVAKESFGVLKTAMSGGILGLVNGLIDAGSWFMTLQEKAGGFSEALALISAVGTESFSRLNDGKDMLKSAFESVTAGIQAAFYSMFGAIIEKFAGMINTLLETANSFMSSVGITKQFALIGQASKEATNQIVNDLQTRAVEAAKAATQSFINMTKPLESWEKIKKLMGGDGEDKSGEEGKAGGKGGGKTSPWSTTVTQGDALQNRYDALQKHLKSREELLTDQYNKDIALLQEYHAREGTEKEKQAADMLALQERYERAVGAIRAREQRAASDAILGGTAQIFAALGERNKKMLRVSKIFGAAQALVSTMIGAAKALEYGFPQGLAAAAAVVAKGIAFVNAIKSTNEGGASGGGGGGGGGGASIGGGGDMGGGVSRGAPARSTAAIINLSGGDMFSRKQVVELINSINEAMEDGARLRIA